MATATKRAWKLQEFVAHSSDVNCLALGHKSGRVMVTGGEDKKVNMWAVGKPNCIMSLAGHTTPVEAVRFGTGEEMVCAGSQSGALKIWDLEAAKIVRTLTGHKSNIRSLEFHPYGDFAASGSMDTNVKLWDVRRKGCIFTYKGHRHTINSLRFSPDGKWIASAGEDGILKLWDLTAGKLLNDFKHAGPVNTVEFHPNEFLIASGSSDRTVKFWDLESFQLVSSTDGDSSPVRCIHFHPDGACLYSGAQDSFKVYGWEPARCFDTLVMGWGKVADVAMAQNQLIGATFSQSSVSTFVVDTQRVHPIPNADSSGDKGAFKCEPETPPPMTASGRRSFVTDRPSTQSTKRAEAPKIENEEEEAVTPSDEQEDEPAADIQDPEDYREIFQPRHTLAREKLPRKVDPFPAPLDDVKDFPVKKKDPFVAPADIVMPPPMTATQANAQEKEKQRPVARTVTNNKPSPKTPAPAPAPAPAPTPKQNYADVPKQDPNSHRGVTADEFLPKENLPFPDKVSQAMSDAEAINSIIQGHSSMIAVMSSRSKNLQIVRALYTGGNVKNAVDSAISMNDLAVLVDLLNVITLKQNLWSLDLCDEILPSLIRLVDSKYDNYVTTGCNALKLILKNFAQLIKANITAPPSSGVDISREERYHKCRSCYGNIMTIRSVINSKGSGNKFREIQLLMNQLD